MCQFIKISILDFLFKQCVEVSHVIVPTSRWSSRLVWCSHISRPPAPPAPPAFAAAGTLLLAQAWWERGVSVVWDCEATSWAGGLLQITLRLLWSCCPLWGLCWWRCGGQRLGWRQKQKKTSTRCRLSHLFSTEQRWRGGPSKQIQDVINQELKIRNCTGTDW